MIVILADNVDTEIDDTVNKLAEEFGGARTTGERERIAEKIYSLIGGNLKGGSVDHTGFIYVVGKDGRFLGYLPPGASPFAANYSPATGGIVVGSRADGSRPSALSTRRAPVKRLAQ